MDLPCRKIIMGRLACNPGGDRGRAGKMRSLPDRNGTDGGGHPLRSLPAHQGNVGYCVEFDEEAKESIRSLAQDLKAGRVESLVDRICAICKQVRRENDRCGTGQECPGP